MNQFPLMRIQGREALKIQRSLNNGLSKIYKKNNESKRQCNVAYNLIKVKGKPALLTRLMTQEEIDLANKKEKIRNNLRIKYKEQMDAIKNMRDFFREYMGINSVYCFVERTSCYSRKLIYSDAGHERVNDYIIKSIKDFNNKL